MNYKLGGEKIRPVNDGSVGIKYLTEKQRVAWMEGKFPVLSIEVRRAPIQPNYRQNGGYQRTRRVQTLLIGMLLKFLAKCSVKRVIPNSSTIAAWNIKRYHPVQKNNCNFVH